MNVRRILLTGAVACALTLAGLALTGCGTPVPDVKGKTPEQAQKAIEGAGFLTGTVTYDENAEGAQGAVIAQMPAGGTTAKKGESVSITVAGAEPVIVPSLVGTQQTAATAALAAVGLKLGDPISDFSTTVVSGAVIQQEPPAGTRVPKGTAISVVVSKGAKPVAPPASSARVKVPALKGLKLATAQSKLNGLGLKWKQVLGPGDGLTAVGFVYKQSPSSGTSVDKGSTVSIYTWTGK